VSGAPDRADVQGLLVRGYSNLRRATLLLLAVSAEERARRWLASATGEVTAGDRRPREAALNLAFTASGLARLGGGERALAGCSPEFLQGPAEPSRARALGDVGESAPQRWAWGGPATRRVDVLVLVYARDREALEGLVARHASPPGLELVTRLDTVERGHHEPFGFRDGISQPTVEGLSTRVPLGGAVRAGEFVLGYPNEYGEEGLVPELGRDGSYLVLRQLEQDVEGFWRFCRDAARGVSSARVPRDDGPEGGVPPQDNPQDATELAARMVGRWPGGAPLVLSPQRDDPALARADDFDYFDLDPHGERCPLGAHIRRVNPRDSLDPKPGSAKSLAVSRHHRILRRARPYGGPGTERGLLFVGLNANLARQFEFVQQTWVCNPNFNGLYDDADPLIAPHEPRGATFTVQGPPLRRRYLGLPRFVTVRGGGYFLLPGLRALRRLAGA
jgi:Dyp-type peroxidase family